MMGVALLLGAIVASPSPGPVDPAIRVCELLVKANLQAPTSYRRIVEARIDGQQVILAFVSLDPHGRPKLESRACLFTLSPDDGRFHIAPFRQTYLEERLEAAKAKLRAAQPGNEAMLARSEIMDINREIFVQRSRRDSAEREAGRMGIYPIAPVSTRVGM